MRDLCSSLTRRKFVLQDCFFQDVVEFLPATSTKQSKKRSLGVLFRWKFFDGWDAILVLSPALVNDRCLSVALVSYVAISLTDVL